MTRRGKWMGMALKAAAVVAGLGIAGVVGGGMALAQDGEKEEGQPLVVSAVELVAEREAPQVCLKFSARLDRGRQQELAALVGLTPLSGGGDAGAAPLETRVALLRDKTLCLEGVSHGGRYRLTAQAGIMAADGRALAAPHTQDLLVPDRQPGVAFRVPAMVPGGATWLPRLNAENVTLRTINANTVKLVVRRISDRETLIRMLFGRLSQTVSAWDAGDQLNRNSTVVWSGDIAPKGGRNVAVLTPLDLAAKAGALLPGVYVIGAEITDPPVAGGGESRSRSASQWGLVSDLGLTAIINADQVQGVARSLSRGQPLAGITVLRLSGEGSSASPVAGGGGGISPAGGSGSASGGEGPFRRTATTDADGVARFESGGKESGKESGKEKEKEEKEDEVLRPQALMAFGPGGDLAFLDLSGVASQFRAAVQDVLLAPERSSLRPGETLSVLALWRDSAGRAVSGQGLMLRLIRPDGAEGGRIVGKESGQGGFRVEIPLPPMAASGRWQVVAHGIEGEGRLGRRLGQSEFQVEEAPPARLELALAADAPRGPDNASALIQVQARTPRGPAALRPGEVAVSVRPARLPFPQHAGYHFGLAQEELAPRRYERPGFTTDARGRARLEIPLESPPESSHPLESVVRATVFDVGGAAVSEELVLPFRRPALMLGVRPHFAGETVSEGATAAFSVLAVDSEGRAVARTGLRWELIEEEYAYSWFEADGRWEYRREVKDHRRSGGDFQVDGTAPAVIEESLEAGRYRLEVFDPASGAVSSLRFSVGWWEGSAASSRPDRVDVAVMLPRYRAGETARVHIRPPYAGRVLVVVADRQIRQVIQTEADADGVFLDIPVTADWSGGGALVRAVALGGGETTGEAAAGPSRRAEGEGWIGLDPSPRLLDVIPGPPVSGGGAASLMVPVQVLGSEAGPAQVLAVVQEEGAARRQMAGVDPVDFFFGRAGGGLALRDSAGWGGGADDAPAVGLLARQPREGRLIGPLTADGEGRATFTLDGWSRSGKARLTVLAWDGQKLGRAETVLEPAIPAHVVLSGPRRLTVGDSARVTLRLETAATVPAEGRLEWRSDGPLTLDGGETETPVRLEGGKTVVMTRVARAGATTGLAALEATVTLPGAQGAVSARSRWALPVESEIPRRQNASVQTLGPEQSLTLEPARLDGLRPETASVSVAAHSRAALDIAAATQALETLRYPDSDSEASRLMGRLALISLAAAGGGDAEAATAAATATAAVRRSLEALAAFQKVDGTFGLWSLEGEPEPWLTVHVLDMLLRARQAGHSVPEGVIRIGLDGLRRVSDRTWIDDAELPVRAYGLYVLAREKVLDTAAVRAFRDTYGARLPTDLARAQVAAALALSGDVAGAAEFAGKLAGGRPLAVGVGDFGAPLRDQAAAVALLAETAALERERLTALARKLAAAVAAAPALSGQDAAWVLRAAAALTLAPGTEEVKVAWGGAEKPVVGRSVSRSLRSGTLPVTLRNVGASEIQVVVSSSGENLAAVSTASTASTASSTASTASTASPPGAGLVVRRRLTDLKGQPLAEGTVRQNDLVVVLVEGESRDGLPHRLVVSDPLPGGLELEIIRTADSPPLGDLHWLGPLSRVRWAGNRDGRFLAAVDLTAERRQFRLVYLARAVTPGRYAWPAVVLDETAAPAQSVRGDGGGFLTVREE